MALTRKSQQIFATGSLAIIVVFMASAVPAAAMQSDSPPFERVWLRTDFPVATGTAARSWLWGPEPLATLREPLDTSPGGMREVRYYDKARMEINDPAADPSSPWYVSNGLLVVEMVSGQVQTGKDKFESREAATQIVAGDPGSGEAPSYATLAKVATLVGEQNRAPDRTGQPVTSTLLRDGTIRPQAPAGTGEAPRLSYHEKVTGHNIPDVFWDFLNRQGIVFENGKYMEGELFDWVYAMGYPITEPHWITVSIGGKSQSVLMQAFQRRVLTYNPANPPEWRVEMGNVGMQYYNWRYGGTANQPPPDARQLTLRRDPDRLKGAYSGIEDPLYQAINSQADWAAFWKRHTANTDPPLSPPAINFANEFVVAAFWGTQPDGCYRLDLQSVNAKEQNIYVVVNQFVTQGSCTLAITQPHEIVAVQKAGLPAGNYNITYVDTKGNLLAHSTLKLP
jgi:hypothetical protein